MSGFTGETSGPSIFPLLSRACREEALPHSLEGGRLTMKRNDQAFTLLEVMVALFIFSVAVLALLAARNQSIKLNETAREQVIMTLLADRKLAEVAGEGFAPVGEASGFFGKTYRQYRWKESITPSPFPIVRQVTVTIMKGRGKKKRSLSLVSFISNIP